MILGNAISWPVLVTLRSRLSTLHGSPRVVNDYENKYSIFWAFCQC